MHAEEEEALALLVVAVVGVEDLRWENKNLINEFKIHKYTNVEQMRRRKFFYATFAQMQRREMLHGRH